MDIFSGKNEEYHDRIMTKHKESVMLGLKEHLFVFGSLLVGDLF